MDLKTIYRDIRSLKSLVATAERAGVTGPAYEAARQYLIAAKAAVEVLSRELQDI